MHLSRQPRPAQEPVTAIFRRRQKVEGCVLYLAYRDGRLAASEKVHPGESEAQAVARLASVIWPNGRRTTLRLVKPNGPSSSLEDDAHRQRSVRALLTRAARAPLSARPGQSVRL